MGMKKKFKDRTIGKILLSKPVKGLLKSIPIVGGLAGNVLDEVKGDGPGEVVSEAGAIHKETMWPQIIGAVATLVILYLALTGKISWDDAKNAKELLAP